MNNASPKYNALNFKLKSGNITAIKDLTASKEKKQNQQQIPQILSVQKINQPVHEVKNLDQDNLINDLNLNFGSMNSSMLIEEMKIILENITEQISTLFKNTGYQSSIEQVLDKNFSVVMKYFSDKMIEMDLVKENSIKIVNEAFLKQIKESKDKTFNVAGMIYDDEFVSLINKLSYTMKEFFKFTRGSFKEVNKSSDSMLDQLYSTKSNLQETFSSISSLVSHNSKTQVQAQNVNRDKNLKEKLGQLEEKINYMNELRNTVSRSVKDLEGSCFKLYEEAKVIFKEMKLLRNFKMEQLSNKADTLFSNDKSDDLIEKNLKLTKELEETKKELKKFIDYNNIASMSNTLNNISNMNNSKSNIFSQTKDSEGFKKSGSVEKRNNFLNSTKNSKLNNPLSQSLSKLNQNKLKTSLDKALDFKIKQNATLNSNPKNSRNISDQTKNLGVEGINTFNVSIEKLDKTDKKLGEAVLDFLNVMASLQDNINSKTNKVPDLKKQFESKKAELIQLSKSLVTYKSIDKSNNQSMASLVSKEEVITGGSNQVVLQQAQLQTKSKVQSGGAIPVPVSHQIEKPVIKIPTPLKTEPKIDDTKDKEIKELKEINEKLNIKTKDYDNIKIQLSSHEKIISALQIENEVLNDYKVKNKQLEDKIKDVLIKNEQLDKVDKEIKRLQETLKIQENEFNKIKSNEQTVKSLLKEEKDLNEKIKKQFQTTLNEQKSKEKLILKIANDVFNTLNQTTIEIWNQCFSKHVNEKFSQSLEESLFNIRKEITSINLDYQDDGTDRDSIIVNACVDFNSWRSEVLKAYIEQINVYIANSKQVSELSLKNDGMLKESTKLKEEKRKLETEFLQSKESLLEFNKKYLKTQDDFSELETKFNDAQNQFTKEKENLTSKLKSKEKELSKFQEINIDGLKDENYNLLKKIESQTKEIDSLVKEIYNLKISNEEIIKDMQVLAPKYKSTLEEIGSLKSLIQTKDKEFNNTKDQIIQQTKEIDDLKIKLAKEEKKSANLNEEKLYIQKKLDLEKDQNSDMKSQISQKDKELNEKIENEKKLRILLEEANTLVTKKENIILSKQEEIEDLTKQYSKSRDEAEKLKEKINENERKIFNLEEELNVLKIDHIELTKKSETLKEMNSMNLKSESSKDSQLIETQNQVMKLNQLISEKDKEISSVNHQLKENIQIKEREIKSLNQLFNEKIHDKEKELSTANAAFKEKVQEKEKTIESLKSQKDAVSKEIVELKEEYNKIIKAKQRLENENGDLLEKINSHYETKDKIEENYKSISKINNDALKISNIEKQKLSEELKQKEETINNIIKDNQELLKKVELLEIDKKEYKNERNEALNKLTEFKNLYNSEKEEQEVNDSDTNNLKNENIILKEEIIKLQEKIKQKTKLIEDEKKSSESIIIEILQKTKKLDKYVNENKDLKEKEKEYNKKMEIADKKSFANNSLIDLKQSTDSYFRTLDTLKNQVEEFSENNKLLEEKLQKALAKIKKYKDLNLNYHSNDSKNKKYNSEIYNTAQSLGHADQIPTNEKNFDILAEKNLTIGDTKLKWILLCEKNVSSVDFNYANTKWVNLADIGGEDSLSKYKRSTSYTYLSAKYNSEFNEIETLKQINDELIKKLENKDTELFNLKQEMKDLTEHKGSKSNIVANEFTYVPQETFNKLNDSYERVDNKNKILEREISKLKDEIEKINEKKKDISDICSKSIEADLSDLIEINEKKAAIVQGLNNRKSIQADISDNKSVSKGGKTDKTDVRNTVNSVKSNNNLETMKENINQLEQDQETNLVQVSF